MPIRFIRAWLVVVLTCSAVFAEQFAVFPDRKELRSPDGKFVIRSVDYAPRPHEFSGPFRSLILQNTTDGSARELYHYVGRVGVAWSGNNFLIVTDYVKRRQPAHSCFASTGQANTWSSIIRVSLRAFQTNIAFNSSATAILFWRSRASRAAC